MMEIGKFAITTIVGYFKMLGNVAKNAGSILADVFTLSWGNIKNDFQNLAKSVPDFGKCVANKFVDMTGTIKKNIKESANAVDAADKTYQKEHGAKVSSTTNEVRTETSTRLSEQAASEKRRAANARTNGNFIIIVGGKKVKDGESDGQGHIYHYDQKKKLWTRTKEKNEDKTKTTTNLDDNTPTPPAAVDDKTLKKQKAAEDKAAREREQQAKKEQEALKLAHDSALAIMEDTIEKRRTQIENQYDDEINKLKYRLATERNLTAVARDAISETIKNKEIKKNQELEKLSDENIKQEVARQQKYIDSRLSVVQKVSAEELALKKQKIDEETKLCLNNLKNDAKTGTLDATEKRDNAKGEMDSAKAKLDSDKANGADADTLAKDQAFYDAKVAAYNDMQEKLTQITAQYEQERKDIETKARQQQAQADLEYAQQQEADRQQVFANRLAELQIEGEQETELQQNLNTLGLDVTTQNEFDQLEVQKQAAQEKLDYLQQFQQQEGETEDEYTQRLADIGMTRQEADTQYLDAKKEKADVDAQINQGEIKNEEAKKKAFQQIGTSMIGMLDTLSESNSAFAKMSKIITLAQIAIDTGKALSAGIASASRLPYPANRCDCRNDSRNGTCERGDRNQYSKVR